MKSLYGKGVDYFFRNVPTVTKKIGLYRRNWQLLCDILNNVNFRNRLVVQHKSIIQNNAVTGKHNRNCLVPIVLFSLQMRLMKIRIFNRMQDP